MSPHVTCDITSPPPLRISSALNQDVLNRQTINLAEMSNTQEVSPNPTRKNAVAQVVERIRNNLKIQATLKHRTFTQIRNLDTVNYSDLNHISGSRMFSTQNKSISQYQSPCHSIP